MNIIELPLSEIKPNEDNPRYISKDKFEKLKKSIQDFPEMLKIRPIVIRNGIALGGNMRLKALQELGHKKAYVIKAEDLTEEQVREFIIKDNVGFGQWDWDVLANDWETTALKEWGLDVWQPEEVVDYSILDDDEGSEEDVELMKDGLRKAIQIEFEIEDHANAMELIAFWRERGAYIGRMIIDHLSAEKYKL